MGWFSVILLPSHRCFNFAAAPKDSIHIRGADRERPAGIFHRAAARKFVGAVRAQAKPGAALDEGIHSLKTEPTVPAEEVRKKTKEWSTV